MNFQLGRVAHASDFDIGISIFARTPRPTSPKATKAKARRPYQGLKSEGTRFW